MGAFGEGMNLIHSLLQQKHAEELTKKQQALAESQSAFHSALEGKLPPAMGYQAYQSMIKGLGKHGEILQPLSTAVEHAWGPKPEPPKPQLNVPQLPPPGGSQGEPAPGIIGAEMPAPPQEESIMDQLQRPVTPSEWFTPQGQAIRKIQGELPQMQFGMQISPVQTAMILNKLKQAGGEKGLEAFNPEQRAEALGLPVKYPTITNIGEGGTAVGPHGEVLAKGQPKPIVSPEGSTVLLPGPPGSGQGLTPVASTPPRLSKDEANLVASAKRTAEKYGFDFDPTKNPRQPLMQVPTQYHQEVQMGADPMLQIRADNLRELRAQRALRSQELAMRVKDFNLTHSPEYINSFVQMMKDDPDLYFDQALNSVRPQVSQAWQQETGLPVPRKLGSNMKQGEETSQIALQHINLVKDLLKDPTVMKRIGPVLGRLGNLEETAGMTVGLSPEEAQKIQKFRTALNYLYFREGRALMGGRPPEQLMKMFAKTSVSPKETLPMLLGSLNGAEAAAKATVDAAHLYRFGGKSAKAPALPPPHGIPDVGSTFNGGKVISVTPIP